MTTPELFDFARAECNKAIALAMAKNADYATGADPFQNLRRGGLFGIAVRMDDKVSRLLNLVKTGAEPKVLSESVRDTAVDLLNYSWLFLALLEELSRGGR
jgi:hypothetical protein